MLDDRSERLERARDRYAHRRPKSRELFARASAVLPAGSTRSVLDVLPFPFRIARARHARLRLVLVPRHAERFDRIAAWLQQQGERVMRRSRPGAVEVAHVQDAGGHRLADPDSVALVRAP